MSTANKDAKFHLKVVMNKHKTKVLYAEANSDFVDVLLSFLSLPLGTIVRVLRKHYGDQTPAIGSLNTLYNGLANLHSAHFHRESGKLMLLNPVSSFETDCRKLKLNVDDTQPTRYFKCVDMKCDSLRYQDVSMYYDTEKCDCGKPMSKPIDVRNSETRDGGGGVFTRRTAYFIISDDLQIMPSVTGYALRFLSNLGITDADGTELMNVTFGFNEIMDLLKGSLLSQTPLTDLILNKRQVDYVTAKYETGTLVHQIKQESTSKTKKMKVKAVLQKSTNKLLFAEAEDDFIEFLFSLLTIPLGTVECLLRGSTFLKNIDNLYRSIADINGDKYFKTQGTKTMLLKPLMPPGYISKNQILPINETYLNLYVNKGSDYEKDYLSTYCLSSPGRCSASVLSKKSPKGPGNYVKGPTMYMVTDGLTVTPLCTTSSLYFLNRLKIPFSDVKEMELEIGLEEALSILKASLTSTCALTDGLMAIINPILNKQP